MRRFAPLLLLFACATQTPPSPPCNAGLALVNASAWFATAAEYRASALQTYGVAQRLLDQALMTGGHTPPAVILDLDETTLDNARFEGRMIRKGITYDAAQWTAWVNESAAEALPGAAEFLRYANGRGVAIFYISNRKEKEEGAGTRANLQRLGFPVDHDTVLLRGTRPEWSSSDKTARRDYVASRYRVLLVLGDDLNDFVDAADKSRPERDALVAANAHRWGTEWLMLPNPMYGSWERAIAPEGTECEKLKKKIEAVEN